MSLQKVRIDKWLWSVRIFKSRSLATKMCDKGFVKLNGDALKASKPIEIGQTITVRVNHTVKTFKILDLIDQRVSAPLAQLCYEDLTEAITPTGTMAFIKPIERARGEGRPTKKERRDLDKWQEDLEE